MGGRKVEDRKPVLTFSRGLILAVTILVNGFVVFALIDLIMSSFGSSNADLLSVIYTIIIMAALVGLAFTPIGENLIRFSLRLRKPTHEEIEILKEPWETVLSAAGLLNDESAPQLFISDANYPNALATGLKTVAVTRGLLKTATPEEIKGVLAHEVGHLIHGDTKISLVVQVVNTVGNVATAILSAIVIFISTIAGSTREREGVAFAIVLSLFALLFKALLSLFQLLIRIGYFAVGRQEEFLADAFAKRLGFANGLVSFLRKIEDFEEAPVGFWNAVQSTHPPTAVRIDKLLYGDNLSKATSL